MATREPGAGGSDTGTAGLPDGWPLDSRAVEAAVRATRIALRAEVVDQPASAGDTRPMPEPDWSSVDPDAFLRAVRIHRIAPLLASHADVVDAPDAIRGQIRAMAKRDVVRGFELAGESTRAVAAVQAAGARVLVFKGVALSAQTTGSVTSRAGGDIDLLVRPEDLGIVHAALTNEGWAGDDLGDPGLQLSWYLRMRRERTYASGASIIDLHWRVGWHDQPLPCTADLLGRAVPVDIGGHEVPTLSAPDALAAACYHAAVDRYARLRGLVDVVRLARRPDAALARDSDWRLRRVVGETVAFTDELIGGIPVGSLATFVPTGGVDVDRVRTIWAHASIRPIWSEYDVPFRELLGVYRDSARFAGGAAALTMAVTDGLLPPELIAPGMGPADVMGAITGELADLVRRRVLVGSGRPMGEAGRP